MRVNRWRRSPLFGSRAPAEASNHRCEATAAATANEASLFASPRRLTGSTFELALCKMLASLRQTHRAGSLPTSGPTDGRASAGERALERHVSLMVQVRGEWFSGAGARGQFVTHTHKQTIGPRALLDTKNKI